MTLLALLPVVACAQQPTPKAEPDLSVVPDAEALRPPSVAPGLGVTSCILETLPTFRGKGNHELNAYIQKQLHWSPIAFGFPDGRIFATFVVDTAGQVCEVSIVQGLHPELDAEVMRVISELTGFTPAKMGRKPVAVRMSPPVQFKIR